MLGSFNLTKIIFFENTSANYIIQYIKFSLLVVSKILQARKVKEFSYTFFLQKALKCLLLYS